ncbi:MAG: 5-formyltetrahydrofolate cyclo-ligase [Acidobacteriota bacterium]|jgi:5-formyltetrahydrofolate cyclo-ligase|nr:5-formyltetrahydrofolate cyclo-ligase [Acidobacteriota bacterium]
MTKAELRKIYLAKQKSLSLFERKQKSEQITDGFFVNLDLNKINFLHCFLPIEKFNEIDTNFIFQKIWRDFPQIETLVPRVNLQTDKIENLIFAPETEIVKNAWEIFEPTNNESIETEKIDVVLIPLLCFDARGFRVGYGKGFYDKFLKNCRVDCLKIGLSYFEPVAEIADLQEFDVQIDFCVTPEKVVNCK